MTETDSNSGDACCTWCGIIMNCNGTYPPTCSPECDKALEDDMDLYEEEMKDD